MLPIPEIADIDIACGSIKHLPKRESLPEEFQKDWHSDKQPYCKAISTWFYKGAKKAPNGNGLEIGGVTFVAKPGVDTAKAIRAIKAVIGSFEPSHEHKIGGCGYMLSEWFDIKEPKEQTK